MVFSLSFYAGERLCGMIDLLYFRRRFSIKYYMLKSFIMKKSRKTILFCLLACLVTVVVSCHKPDPADPVDPVAPVSIVGQWKLYNASQLVTYPDGTTQDVDMMNIYGQNFRLIFEENGTLVTINEYESAEMQWTLNGDTLGFIQSPGLDPVMYLVNKLVSDTLVIEHGTGTNNVTLMEFYRGESEDF